MKEYFCKHLDGPVVNVVKTCVIDFLRSFVVGLCTYLRTLSITTANFYHLNFIGRLMGFPRPYTPGDEIAEDYLKYAGTYTPLTDKSFKLANNYMEFVYGIPYGVFSATPDGGYGDETTPIADGNYRALLHAVGDLKCNVVSMKALHDMCYSFLGNDDYEIRPDANLPDRYTLWIGNENTIAQGIALNALIQECYRGYLWIDFEHEDFGL